MTEPSDAWAAGAAYDDFMGRWSRLLAPRFVSWLGVRPGASWLDVGCGTGALSGAICAGADPASVVACDPSEPFVAYARRRRVDPRISFAVAGVGQLPTRPGGFDSVTSLLALNFFPDPGAAIGEMRRIASANGLVSACVWDYAGRMELLRCFWDSAAAVDGRASELDEGGRFAICRPDALASLFRDAGLADVVSDAIEIPTRFSTFAEYWTSFLGGTGPAPSYVASLDSAHREALAARLERSLRRDAAGAISLVARAWVVRGVARTEGADD
ncbi:MAG TPA: class I SAM-dependent methyltransferase [Candidatus Binatia bacterium]|nr:class I SAM-dependent methyltransferase [Candidatus Binatia bacterium]